MTKLSIVIAFALAILFAVAQNAVINRNQKSSDRIGERAQQKLTISNSPELDSTRTAY